MFKTIFHDHSKLFIFISFIIIVSPAVAWPTIPPDLRELECDQFNDQEFCLIQTT